MGAADAAEAGHWRPRAGAIWAAAGLAAYVALGTFATLVAPPAIVVFLIPPALAVLARAPILRAAPKLGVLRLIQAGVLLYAVWPVYLHVKLGPLPILTPPRALLYAITACWLYDMTASPLRRAQFVHALRNGKAVAIPVLALFGLGALGLPFAEGKSIALAEFLRQCAIWLAPFLAALTYVRRPRELRSILAILTIGAAASGAIALAEAASGTLLAELLSPLISDASQWLQAAQEQKIRDGVFRAQAGHTHPLSLGEFLVFSAPIALGLAIGARRAVVRASYFGVFALIVGGALATNSRGAVLALGLALLAFLLLLAQRAFRKARAERFRPLAGLAVLTLLIATPLLAVGAYRLVIGAGGEQAARSTQSRLDQIEQAWPKIMKRPLAGYGTGRAARVLGYWGTTLTLDNYYLSLALDLGLMGPIIFLAIMAGFGTAALRRAGRAPPELAPLYLGLACAAASFSLTRSIVSMTGNLSILYLVLAAAAAAGAPSRRRSL